MKKNSIAKLQVSKRQLRQMAAQQRLTVGLDQGDRETRCCILNETGERASEGKVATTKEGLQSILGKMTPSRMALEVGTHSPWVSGQLKELGHEVIVANPRKVRTPRSARIWATGWKVMSPLLNIIWARLSSWFRTILALVWTAHTTRWRLHYGVASCQPVRENPGG